MRNEVLNNETEVKLKMLELTNEDAAKNSRSEADTRADTLKAEKLKKRISFLVNRAIENEDKMKKIGCAETMSDNEIRKNFLESKEWVKEANDLKQIKEKIEEEVVGVDIDEAEIKKMSDDVDRCVDVLITKMEIFKFEDDIRGLFTGINKNLSRENVVFPDKFAGEPGDNVYKFKEKFLEALHDSQVREKDKVEVLQKHLTGNAKTLLGDHYTDIEKAMQSLIEYFGNKNKIWSKCKNEFLNHFSGNPRKIWGLYGENKRVMAISKVMEFL